MVFYHIAATRAVISKIALIDSIFELLEQALWTIFLQIAADFHLIDELCKITLLPLFYRVPFGTEVRCELTRF